LTTPTTSPSSQAYPIISFKSDFTFENITTVSLDKKAQNTVIKTTAKSMNVSDSCVIYLSSSSSSYSSYSSYSLESVFVDNDLNVELQQNEEIPGVTQHIKSFIIEGMDTSVATTTTDSTYTYNNDTIIITTLTQVQVTDSYDTKTLYSYLTNKLSKAVESGRYTKMLHSTAQSYGAVDLYYVNVSKVVNYDENGMLYVMRSSRL